MALPPLELFSLEREGRLLPGGLFVCLNCEQGGHDDQTLEVTKKSAAVDETSPTPSRISSLRTHCDTSAGESLRGHREIRREKNNSRQSSALAADVRSRRTRPVSF